MPTPQPDPTAQPPNFGVGDTYSWVKVRGLESFREMYARATYVTNLKDLTVSMSATDLRIGGVEIVDNDSGLRCDVTSFDYEDGSYNALRVVTQDLEPTYDGVSLGDTEGNMVGVNVNTSSLFVDVTNLNALTAITQYEFDQTQTFLSTLTSLTQSGITLLNALTSRELTINLDTSAININTDEIEALIRTSNTFLNSVTGLEQKIDNSINNLVNVTISGNNLVSILTGYDFATTSLQRTQNTLLNTLTSNSVYGTTINIPQYSSIVNFNSLSSVIQSGTIISLLNALTAREYDININAGDINLNTDEIEGQLQQTTTLLEVLTANSFYGTVSAYPLHVTGNLSAVISTPVTAMNVTVVNPASAATLVSFADSVQLDQSSRLRVSTVGNQWWYTSSVDKDGDLRYIESFVNAASSTFMHGASSRFVQNLGSVNLTSGLSATGSTIRASRRRHKIIPGISHEYFGTWNWDGKQTNVVKRMGMFTNFNGYCFELSGTDFNVLVRRRLTDGTLVEERVERKDFNGDKLDGTGPSGENWGALTTFAAITGYISTTPIQIGQTTIYNVVYGLSAGQAGNFRQGGKATISGMSPASYNQVATISKFDTTTNRLTATYLIDPNTFSSLTVSPSGMVQTAYHMQHTYWFDFMGGRTNRVRFGKVSDYGNIVLHTYRFDGLLGTAYENAPALMDRKEIFNVGPVSGTPSFTVMGNSFNVEAEANLNPSFGVAFTNQNVTFDKNQGQEFAVLGIGLREGEPYQRADLQVQRIQVVDIGNINQQNAGVFQWRLVLNPTFGGTAVPAPIDIGKATHVWDYATGTTVTGGFDLIGGYVQANTTLEVQTALNFLNMGSNIEYTNADKAVLVLKEKVGGINAAKINATINFIEAL
jgi:hypothetical protein